MNVNLIVIDNFYSDADTVRKFALEQSFYRYGNYPGGRTKNFLEEDLKNKIQSILLPFAGKVINWHDSSEDSYSGSFQLTISQHKSWVHTDKRGNWGGVLYLTPNAPSSGGTGFFRSKIDSSLTDSSNFLDRVNKEIINSRYEAMQLGDFDSELEDPNKIWYDLDKWEKLTEVSNIYNRLILFRSNQWHSSLEYFGEDNETGRLTQVFFIKAEH